MKSSRSSAELRKYVEKARNIQSKRFKGITGINCNAQLNDRMIKEFCSIDEESKAVLKEVFDKYGLSARSYNRLLKIARTFADMDCALNIRKKDIVSAVWARGLKP